MFGIRTWTGWRLHHVTTGIFVHWHSYQQLPTANRKAIDYTKWEAQPLLDCVVWKLDHWCWKYILKASWDLLAGETFWFTKPRIEAWRHFLLFACSCFSARWKETKFTCRQLQVLMRSLVQHSNTGANICTQCRAQFSGCTVFASVPTASYDCSKDLRKALWMGR